MRYLCGVWTQAGQKMICTSCRKERQRNVWSQVRSLIHFVTILSENREQTWSRRPQVRKYHLASRFGWRGCLGYLHPWEADKIFFTGSCKGGVRT